MTSSVAAAGSYWVAVCRDAAPFPSSDCSSVHRVHQCETTRAACRWILKSVFACIWNVVCIYNPHAVPQLNKIVSRSRMRRRRRGWALNIHLNAKKAAREMGNYPKNIPNSVAILIGWSWDFFAAPLTAIYQSSSHSCSTSLCLFVPMWNWLCWLGEWLWLSQSVLVLFVPH